MNDSLIAILGVVAGFVAAFFAEPVKSYFAERAKLKNIRLSLYKEISQNLLNISACTIDSLSDEQVSLLLIDWISNKCYKNIVENSVEEYYRLEDVMTIDKIYKWVNLLISPYNKTREEHGKRLRILGKIFVNSVVDNLEKENLSKKIMAKAVGKEAMNEISKIKRSQVNESLL